MSKHIDLISDMAPAMRASLTEYARRRFFAYAVDRLRIEKFTDASPADPFGVVYNEVDTEVGRWQMPFVNIVAAELARAIELPENPADTQIVKQARTLAGTFPGKTSIERQVAADLVAHAAAEQIAIATTFTDLPVSKETRKAILDLWLSWDNGSRTEDHGSYEYRMSYGRIHGHSNPPEGAEAEASLVFMSLVPEVSNSFGLIE